jgi:hypothetical protein
VGLSAYQSAKCAVGGFSTSLAEAVTRSASRSLSGAGRHGHRLGRIVHDHPADQRALPADGWSIADILKAMSGSEESDPAKVAKVEGELVGGQGAPLRMVLGAQAYRTVQDTAKALAASDEKWRTWSESVVFS